MNDAVLKNFAVNARRSLIEQVMQRAEMYAVTLTTDIDEHEQVVNSIALSEKEVQQRAKLLEHIHGLTQDEYETFIERVAYTWFNRFVALRFMEANDRIPGHIRMFTNTEGTFEPEVLREALDLSIENLDMNRVAELVSDGNDEELFRLIFLAECEELAGFMPSVFDPVDEAFELLLPGGLLRKGSVLDSLVNDIPESDWTEGVQIVGWLYQYYVSEKKDEVFASFKKGKKAEKDAIAPATQLFTPHWIVQYLTENSLGRLWMLNNPSSHLTDEMDYYIAPEEGAELDYLHISSPEEITVNDPACGSGHILVYAFELLAKMYEEAGYSTREIPSLILEKNLSGFEIDPRAAGLASFALTMKACELDSRFLKRDVHPNITVLEPIVFDEAELAEVPVLQANVQLTDELAHLSECGSLLVPTIEDINVLKDSLSQIKNSSATMFTGSLEEKLTRAQDACESLSSKFTVVVANPPYMGSKNMNSWTSAWVKKNYESVKSDLFSAFMVRNLNCTVRGGQLGLMTPYVWMFIGSYEALRKRLIEQETITSLVQLEYSGFDGATVPICTFTLQKGFLSDFRGGYVRLSDFVGSDLQNPKTLEAIQNPDCGWLYRADAASFKAIPGMPIAYWVSNKEVFSYDKIELYYESAGRNKTHNNDLYTRKWWEVDDYKRWQPYANGGTFRRWYGNDQDVVDWSDEAKVYYSSKGGLYNQKYLGLEGVCWNLITSYKNGFRIKQPYEHFSSASPTIVCMNNDYNQFLVALLNSNVVSDILQIFNPTLNTTVGDVLNLPIIFDQKIDIEKLSCRAIEISKLDWECFETSVGFSNNPLVSIHDKANLNLMESSYKAVKKQTNDRFKMLKSIEENLNSRFALNYCYKGDSWTMVDDRDVTVSYIIDKASSIPDGLKANPYVLTLRDVICAFISYAVGCMFGRYSLDIDGLVLANQGDTVKDYLVKMSDSSHVTFMPDENNVLPICDDEYFSDDIVGRFIEFVRVVYGDETLEENLQFIADALGGKGTSREVIRNYFMKDFFKDHCQTYKKRPIYWLLDSGKKGGFRALIYMHRYQSDLLARIRTDYVHEQQERYRTQIASIEDALVTAEKREKVALEKQLKKIKEQLAETHEFEEKLHHLADQMIEIDLDDGVKVNYEKFADVLAKIK